MVKTATKTEVKTETETAPPVYYFALGRRKEASARVRLYVVNEGAITLDGQTYEKGTIIINGKPVGKYFGGAVAEKLYLEPFRTTNTLGRFVTTVKIEGGGSHGQMGAMIHGISRALVKIDSEKYRPTLKKRGFLTRDPRAKQRRKAGFAQKSRKKKQSPKR